MACAVAHPAYADDGAAARAALSRSLRSSAFLGAELNARQRSAVYASDAEDGASGRSELRAFVYGSGDVGPLGLYLGLGAIARFGQPNAMIGDPFADPYDDFEIGRGLRLFSAHVEYAAETDGKKTFGIRAGRLTDFDRRSQLLVYDGARLFANVGSSIRLFAYGGRRALLDGGLPDQRTTALSQLVAGAGGIIRTGTVDLHLTYRLEELHRAIARGTYRTEALFLDMTVEARLGGTTALDAHDFVFPQEYDDLGVALVVRHDGGFSTDSRRLSIDWRAQVQLGRDPVIFGRGGLGAREADLNAALGAPIFRGSLDRLFFGPQPAHVLGEAEAQWWPLDTLVFALGGFTRQPLSAEDRTSIRPGIIEVYGGPEVRLLQQHRVGAQVRYAIEDPGEPGRVFDDFGDGERNSGAILVYAELPFLLSDVWRLALRPEFEARQFSNRGPLATADNQKAFFGGLYAAASMHDDLLIGLRYGAGTMPSFYADGVSLTHDFELTVGGRY